MQLEGKVAIVTGAARGIGYAIAKRFLMDGASVVLSDIDNTATLQAVKDLEQFGDARAMAADVGDKLDIHNLMTYTVTNLGEIDILVNNAGIVHKTDFLDLKEEDFDRVMRVNLKGAFLCGQAVAKRMVARVEAGGEAGTIINMSSINAIFGLPDQLAYSVSKGGLSQLTRTMAVALAKWGIRVNAIGPGSIQTDMLSAVNADAEARKTILSRTPLGRIGDPAEIASIASFLASRDASYITGQTIYADGGRLPLSYLAEPPFKP
ncbi:MULTISPECIES: SDR family NAD(P)-dependent oxidoreductase [Brucella/Ochrobactrum group]|uniref:3-oxoacyl-[acyl-carrier protein] reductase n=1 Tax=Ochrobactrum soli TaxID=2448455 RepID=A0A2P9HQJ1_9HYPH|nr:MULTISPECIES: glucose 1-dehydrogenase [Brucella]MCI0999956.1 glucose 1-dehydrogenase [Ochrobactrum sp. C6C9]RRD24235.1 glucose 1-dehydrogenase [Brucellaceae bacterium VT-16-1752]WHT41800.1 glucose 1-dehydrogenase [Ochrobactrum sp. SSR]MDX4073536.1 glucose 1-dehydrogenase [Brucella sp. NBRC 113783]WHS31726.1 glucose 1-dehydrogenase [Brucella sp. NM4]